MVMDNQGVNLGAAVNGLAPTLARLTAPPDRARARFAVVGQRFAVRWWCECLAVYFRRVLLAVQDYAHSFRQGTHRSAILVGLVFGVALVSRRLDLRHLRLGHGHLGECVVDRRRRGQTTNATPPRRGSPAPAAPLAARWAPPK